MSKNSIHLLFIPTGSYWEGSELADIKASFQPIFEKLDRDGPYDGVLVFSQGAALMASFLLYLQSQNQPSPFRFAIFVCGGVSYSVLEDRNVQVSPKARGWEKIMNACLDGIVASKDGQDPNSDFIFDSNASFDFHDVFGLDVLQPSLRKLQINIPTVHVHGSKDPTYPLSRQLEQFCNATCGISYNHGEGHVIPRKKQVSECMAKLVNWAMEMAIEY